MNKNLTTTLALIFTLVSGLVAVVRWADGLDKRLAVVEAQEHYYHGLDKAPDGD